RATRGSSTSATRGSISPARSSRARSPRRGSSIFAEQRLRLRLQLRPRLRLRSGPGQERDLRGVHALALAHHDLATPALDPQHVAARPAIEVGRGARVSRTIVTAHAGGARLAATLERVVASRTLDVARRLTGEAVARDRLEHEPRLLGGGGDEPAPPAAVGGDRDDRGVPALAKAHDALDDEVGVDLRIADVDHDDVAHPQRL